MGAVPGRIPAKRPAKRRSLALGLLTAFAAALAFGHGARAAQSSDAEELFNADESGEAAAPQEARPIETAPGAGDAKNPSASVQVKKLSDLSGLSPFSDIAVIQKRYLPKTHRFELFGGAQTILNDPFFVNFGLALRLGYNFRERWGVEFIGSLLTTYERDVTKGLEDRRITTTSLVSPTHYYGLDVKWSPIYGKMTLINKKIVPFDLYFSLGAGETGTNQGAEAPTLHLGTGQIFAINKSFAFRWDISWNAYSSASGADPSRGTSIYNNVFMTLGASWFFPEATYR